MANTSIPITRAHLILALCLPLAILLGYLLAEPLDPATLAIVLLLIGVLSVPLLMKWHHPLLILSWHSAVNLSFLPGYPDLWLVMVPISAVFLLLNRSINPEFRFVHVPAITQSLVAFGAVVIMTALARGGIGLSILGSAHYGGRKFVYTIAAIIGYFVLCSRTIPTHRAPLYAALFFLPSLTAAMPGLIQAGGPIFYPLFSLFPPNSDMDLGESVFSPVALVTRPTGLGGVALGLSWFLLARYGIRGILDIARPWRGVLFLLSAVASMACGFRSNLILFLMLPAVLFFIEGLHRTRLLGVIVALCVAGAAVLVPFAERMPNAIQRTISFLPIKVDPLVQMEAQASTQWRVDMWNAVLPMVPKYLFLGKGYGIDANDLYLDIQASYRGSENYRGAMSAGDYHSGPLTLVIPFGIWGVLAFGWFVLASIRMLYHYCKFGDPQLLTINRLLLAMFIANVLFFILVFGSLSTDLSVFTGLAGLAVSLNGAPRRLPEEPHAETSPALEAFA